jgi:hypothetical protein
VKNQFFGKELFKSKFLAVILITVGFGGLYVALRSMPSAACGFLHYAPEGVNSDGVELCAAQGTSYIDLSVLTFPVKFDAEWPSQRIAGEPMQSEFFLIGPTGKVILPHEIAFSHTQQIHLMLIDEELIDYQHLHPLVMDASGRWTFDWTPQRASRYHVFAQWVQAATSREVIATSTCVVKSTDREDFEIASLNTALHQERDGYCFELQWQNAPHLSAGVPTNLTFIITRGDCAAFSIEPIMAAYAHLVAFDFGLKGIAHLHPMPTGEEKTPHRVQLVFMFSTTLAGHYRLWAQCQLNGVIFYIPFDLYVED